MNSEGSGERGALSSDAGKRELGGEQGAGSEMSSRQQGSKQFRFQDLTVWQRAAELSPGLFALADDLERKRLYRFAEQLRAATLSITNNIAEGSGSTSDVDFAHFLNVSRRSVFEVANMLVILSRSECIDRELLSAKLSDLEDLSRMLFAFQRRLRS